MTAALQAAVTANYGLHTMNSVLNDGPITSRSRPAAITENVSWQEDAQDLIEVFQQPVDDERQVRLHHVVNLFATKSGSLDQTQSRTIETMRTARLVAHQLDSKLEVIHAAVMATTDADLAPPDFVRTSPLARSIQDVEGFATGQSYPLLFDIFEQVLDLDVDGHIVFSNSDICLQPSFYAFVAQALRQGHDAMVINRRTIPASGVTVSPLTAAAEVGEDHPGLDCFVFPASWLSEFQRNDACIGAGFVMRGLLHNLVALADDLLVVTRAMLTFHYGDDRPWAEPNQLPYSQHNQREDRRSFDALCNNPTARDRLRAFHAVKPKYEPPRPSGFDSPRYAQINKARLEHLASLPLDLANVSVLELGSGPGDLTGFFLDRGCSVTSIDARESNVSRLQARHPAATGLVVDLDNEPPSLGKKFDVVFMYGLLYHVGAAAELLRWAADHCSGILLMSTVVDPGNESVLVPASEKKERDTQSFTGLASRPTRAWVMEQLSSHFAYASMSRTQPSHFEFPQDWSAAPTLEAQKSSGLCRAVFVGSHDALQASAFSTEVLDRHDPHDG